MDFNASIVVYTRDVYGVSGNRTHSYTGTDCIIGSPLCCIVINYLDQIEQQERDQGAYRRSPIVVLFVFFSNIFVCLPRFRVSMPPPPSTTINLLPTPMGPIKFLSRGGGVYQIVFWVILLSVNAKPQTPFRSEHDEGKIGTDFSPN